MMLKQYKKYSKGVKVKFNYYYEDKIGTISEVLDNKYFILSNKIEYPVNHDKIYGKIIEENDKENDIGSVEGSDSVLGKE